MSSDDSRSACSPSVFGAGKHAYDVLAAVPADDELAHLPRETLHELVRLVMQ